MTVYLVDFENVRSEGLKGVELLTPEDKVVIFYSQNANSITFDVHALLRKSSAEIETYHILRGGHNSLDFQLSTYLGYLVMENSFREIVIISKDKGFLCVTNFWEENSDKCNCKIKLCKSIGAAINDVVLANDIDDGLSGNFIERVSGKDGVILSVNGEEVIHDAIEESGTSEREEHTKETFSDGNVPVRSYGRPPAPKRTNYSTNIFTKAEPYYRVTSQETTVKQKPWQEQTKKNEPWKQNPGEQKPWKPEKKQAGQSKKKKKSEEEHKDTDTEKKVLPPNPQNATSKNKIFAAEVKFNINEDVEALIREKYDASYVPMLVDAIGMSTGKQHFYKMMVNKVGQEVGLDLYRLIKGHYANLKRK